MKLPVFHVSSQNYAAMKELKECLVDVAREKCVHVPESWVEFYRKIIETKKIYLTLNEIAQLFPGAPSNKPETTGGATRSETDHKVPLQYFADSNLCLHYEEHTFLKDYVFPDIDQLVNLFKSLFHQNIGEMLCYNNNERLQAKFQKVEFHSVVRQHEKEGLLCSELLSYLWKKYGLSHDKDVLLQLMQSSISAIVSPKMKMNKYIFSLVCGVTTGP